MENTALKAINKTSRDIYLDAVKGFLILCIVLEHNHLLTTQYDWIRPFSDAFAAGCFLILTFAWPLKKTNLLNFVDKYFSYWWPFIGFITATSILNFYFYNNSQYSHAILSYFNAILLASPQAIKVSSGFMYFWFLPCLCLLYLIRRVLSYVGKHAYIIAFIPWLLIGELSDELLIRTPYSLHVIAFILPIGLCYSKLHKRLIQPSLVMRVSTVIAFITCAVSSYFIGWELFLAGGIIPSIKQPALLVFYSVFMLVAIPGIYNLFSFTPKLISNFFAFIGTHSMKVYLLHPLIYISITKILPIIDGAILSFLITIALSLLVSHVLVKVAALNKLIFPNAFSALNFSRKS
tara:strand:- start:491 stop:1537 length:1047 start_codon:yes stop_codon:yes gene_type:complete